MAREDYRVDRQQAGAERGALLVPPRPTRESVCAVAGDPQVVELTISTLPAATAAGTLISESFGGGVRGLLVPLGEYGGGTWSRSARAFNATNRAQNPAIPLAVGRPIAIDVPGGRNVAVRQNALISSSGVCSLVYYPMPDADLDDPYLLAAYAVNGPSSGASSGPLVKVAAPLNTGRVATAAGETVLVTANAARSAMWVQNVGSVAFGLRYVAGGATLIEIAAGAAWEMPAGVVYTGEILTVGGVSTASFIEY